MMTTQHPLVAGYLHRLRAETADLPPEERDELVSSIAEHIATSLAEAPDPQEADIQAVLNRLGSPAAIAMEARRQSSGRPVTWAKPGALEWGGVAMLGIGSYVLPIIGTIAGLIMISMSPWWTTRQKVLASGISLFAVLLVPLGIGFFLIAERTTEGPLVPLPIVSFEPAPSQKP